MTSREPTDPTSNLSDEEPDGDRLIANSTTGRIEGRFLAGRVVLVAGATRGCGRAIAVELGALGATVYATGRSTRAARSPMERPETIEETAERVDAAGGHAVAVRCDHSVAADVAALTERLRNDEGRLDILVNDVWGGDPFVRWNHTIWQHPLDDTLRIVRNGLETHLITNHYLLPLVLGSSDGLVVEVGDGKGNAPFRTNVAYDLVKHGVVRLGDDLAHELAPHGVTAVSVTPGFLRSEAMLDGFGVSEANWRQTATTVDFFEYSETPHLLGRGVAALAADPSRHRFTGRCLGSWDLMNEYGLKDLDGSRPDWGAVDAEARQRMLDEGFPTPDANRP